MTLNEIRTRLQMNFPDAEIELTDLSGNASNVRVEINTTAFAGLSRVKQHQAIMDVFSEELSSGEIHALSIQSGPKLST